MGFKRGESNPCVFRHETIDIDNLVHGEDYVSSVCLSQLEWLKKNLERAFTLKSTIIGSDPSLGKDMVVLG